MIKHFKLEEKYCKSEENKEEKEYILYYYLKEMISSYLKECEVMEVLSDHIEAFGLEFQTINQCLLETVRMKPERSLFAYEGEDFLEYTKCHPREKIMNEKLKKTILKVKGLLIDKIRYQ